MRAALQAKGIDFDELQDPWGMRLRVKYSFRRSQKILEFVSSGIDKKPGSGDDFAVATFHWPYFRKLGRQIDSASNTYFQTTGKYIRVNKIEIVRAGSSGAVNASVVASYCIGFRGYGMMLAEVGLPPGAEVDRASLEEAENSGAASGYEIQPDRVVFYVWPAAGGTTWSFDFRMRYRSSAMTAASRLYDYYNPDANATVAPVRFTVR